MNEFIPLVCFVVFSSAFALASLIASFILAPKTNDKNKLTNYECGVPLFSNARVQYNPNFLMYAIVFIIFEIETIMLFPFAVAFSKLGLFAFVEAIIFVGIILLGLYYAIAKKLLRWK